jgi:hypothetical protein
MRAGCETAVSIESKCEGWYKASDSILMPAIEEKNQLRHRLQDKSNLTDDELADLQLKLKQINKRNHDLVDLAKARWYSGICSNIHNMRFNPHLAWENINLLTGDETAHHKTNINMAMKLDNGDLASNTKKNMSVFSMHFHKVLNNHRPVDDSVLELIPQKPCLTDIDTPITFREVKRAITKLKKGKAPSLNGIPPEPSKPWTMRQNELSTNTFRTSLKARQIMKPGREANASQYRRRAISATPTNGVESC